MAEGGIAGLGNMWSGEVSLCYDTVTSCSVMSGRLDKLSFRVVG
jgi:hypothetical protein